MKNLTPAQIPKRFSWITENEKIIFHTPIMDLIQRDCRSSEDQRPHPFYVLTSRDWCNIIPITTDGKIVLVKQYRVGIEAHTLEIPGGITDATDNHALGSALRELTEETGYAPAPNARCLPIGSCHPNPAILNNRAHFFVVGPVIKSSAQNLDPGEMIEVVELPIADIPDAIRRGDITHTLTLNALTFFNLKFSEDSQALIRGLEDFCRSP
ncbi:NUDIX hydrolase [Bdellovibrionota bacterium FG-2]